MDILCKIPFFNPSYPLAKSLYYAIIKPYLTKVILTTENDSLEVIE